MLIIDAAREAAEKVLRNRWDGAFPIDPKKLTEDFGITVAAASFKEPGISGAIFANGPDDVKVFYHHAEDFERQRFTIAHELGHFLERQAAPREDGMYSFVEKRGQEYNLHEFYADEFAGNLLMPADKFIQKWAELQSVSALADFFGVSFSAAQKRLQRLRKYQAIA